ncbi:MAG: YihY/virulence factor BrkB family protein [Thermodesulfobacteriota bacterium]
MSEAQPAGAAPGHEAGAGLGARLGRLWQDGLAWLWQPRRPRESELAFGLRALLRIGHITILESDRNRISLRASALTFTVLLALVPTLALTTAVLKGFGAGDQMRQAAYRLIDQFEAGPLVLAPQAAAPEPDAGAPGAPSFGGHLRQAVDQIFAYVDRTNFATLGAFGIIGLLMAAISVLSTIERAMNTIWRADSGRPLGRRLMDYLALMILLPVAVNVAFAAEATLQSQSLLSRLQAVLPLELVTGLLLKLLPVLAVVGTFTILYRFVPNSRVRFLPALAGGACGGVGWLAVQGLYVSLQVGVARYNAIYGSFATLPLFLVWMHLGWVIFLTGAEVAFAVQAWPDYQHHEEPLSPLGRLGLAFAILSLAQAEHAQRRVLLRATLGPRLGPLPPHAAAEVLEALQAGGFLRRVAENGDGFVPAAPNGMIDAAEVVDHILARGASGPLPPLAQDVMAGARAAVSGRSLSGEPSEAAGPDLRPATLADLASRKPRP